MQLIGRNVSPFVRRTAISLKLMGYDYEQVPLATADQGAEIARYNPIVRVPALVLDDGETLIDSAAIIDHLNEQAPPGRQLLPMSGPERRAVLRSVAIGLGVAEKAVAAFYEKTRRPEDKQYQPWLEQLLAQVVGGIAALNDDLGEREWLCGDTLSLADVTAVCAYGIAAAVVPSIAGDDRYAALRGLSERCHRLPAFSETAPKAA